MPKIVFRGTRDQLMDRLRDFAGVITGRVPDSTGVVEDFLMVGALVILGKIQESFVIKSEGGTDDLGIRWAPLSPVTLALRNKTSSGKVVAKITANMPKMPIHRQRLVKIHYERLLSVYQANKSASSSGRAARNYAKKLLEIIKPNISPTRYKKLKGELQEQDDPKAYRLAAAGAVAMILRVSGDLLRSLSPEIQHPMRVLQVVPGSIHIGSRIAWMKFHQSSLPRKLKASGEPKLPRRQILPDKEKPIPSKWKKEVNRQWKKTLMSPALWIRFLQPVSR